MRKPKINRMVLAMCLGSFIMLLFYFQTNLKPDKAMDMPLVKGSLSGTHSMLFTLLTLWDYAAVYFVLAPSSLMTLYLQAFKRRNERDFTMETSPLQALHQGRRELLEETCHSYTRKRRVLIPEDLKHLIVDDRHGLLYCYVPKVACTNWKRVLMVLTGEPGQRDPLQIPANEAHVPGNLRTLSEYSTSEINQRLRTYLKFLFVREPFERLVSAYRNKFTRSYNTAFHKRYGTKIIRRHRPDPLPEALERGDDVTFAEFVYYLVDPSTQREEPFNEHWERVHSLCHPCLIHYDVVGKYETLEEDSNYVLKLAGVDSEVTFPSLAKSTRTTGDMAASFFKNISPVYQKKLYNLYRMDFLLFNYSVPDYLKFR